MQYRHALAGAICIAGEHGFEAVVRQFGDMLTETASHDRLLTYALLVLCGVVATIAVSHTGHHIAEWLEAQHEKDEE